MYIHTLDGSETNKDFDKIIQRLAREAASSDDGIKISPLINTDRKGGAYPIMLQQFKRAIGVAIIRGNAKHKLARLHYVRATAAEAAYTCRTNHSDKKWNPLFQASSHNTSQKDTIDMTSVCIECTQSHYMFFMFLCTSMYHK